MIIDFHTHVGIDKDGCRQSIKELSESMSKNNITYSCVFPFNEQNTDVFHASMDLLNACDGAMIPFLRFDPKIMTCEELNNVICKFRAIKLHPRSQNFDPLDKNFFPLYDVIAQRGKPLLFHTRKENIPYTDPDRICELARFFPELKIILGHFANISPIAIDMVSKFENLFLETSALSSHKMIELVVKKVGAHKVLFGSDQPYSDQEVELLKIKKADVSEAEKEQILGGNAAKLLGLASTALKLAALPKPIANN